MKQWAEIVNGRVRHTFETKDNFTPEFGPPITVVEITGRSPKPEQGWLYDKGADVFTLSTSPKPPVDADAEAARVLIEQTGMLAPSAAMKLLLKKAYGL